MARREQMSKYKILTKVPWDRKSIIYYVLLLFVSCLYPIIFDSSAIAIAANSPSEDVTLKLVSISYALGLFFILMLSRWVFIIACPLLFYIGGLSSLYSEKLALATNEITAPLFFKNAVISFFISTPSSGAFIAMTFILGLVIGLIRFYAAADNSAIRRGQAFALILFAVAGGARYMTEIKNDFSPAPFAYISGVQKYLAGNVSRLLFSKNKIDLTASSKTTDITVVLISVEKLSDTLINDNYSIPLTVDSTIFTKIEPCSPDYGISLLCTLTRADKDNFTPAAEEKTITSMFSSAGYDTSWINMSSKLILKSAYISQVAKEAQNYKSIESSGSPNPFTVFDTVEKLTAKEGKNFIAINIEGIFPKTETRYNKIFEKNRADMGSETIGQYKNYLDSLDAFIYEMARKLSDKKAVIIFTGLSGEDIENTVKKTENNSTYFQIWISPALDEETFYRRIIRENSATYAEINQSWLFHTIAGCGGLRSENIDQSKNLCGQLVH